MFYADPGSGVLIWQLLLAIFFGATFYFSRLREWASAKLRPGQGSALTTARDSARNQLPSNQAEDQNHQLPGEAE